VATVAVGGCAYHGGDIGNPLTRKAQWLSFLGGDDIAAACGPAAPERVRLVYNALWDREARVYEWTGAGALAIRIVRPMDLGRFDLDDPLGPWRAEAVTVPLDAATRVRLNDAVAEAGGFGPPALGLELPSHSYYWASATCHAGHFTFTGWSYPSAAFADARFPALLAALDPGRATIPTPAAVPLDLDREATRRDGVSGEFTVKVGAAGPVR
jgi:hypothetical protein